MTAHCAWDLMQLELLYKELQKHKEETDILASKT